MYNTVEYLLKKDLPSEPKIIKNVIQVDICNMAELDGEVSDSDWNFVSILFEEQNEKKKIMLKLDEIWQLFIVRDK